MGRKRYIPEQIISMLREAEVLQIRGDLAAMVNRFNPGNAAPVKIDVVNTKTLSGPNGSTPFSFIPYSNSPILSDRLYVDNSLLVQYFFQSGQHSGNIFRSRCMPHQPDPPYLTC